MYTSGGFFNKWVIMAFLVLILALAIVLPLVRMAVNLFAMFFLLAVVGILVILFLTWLSRRRGHEPHP